MADMKFRKLRIAWSVGCGIACVLLIVLWVRSYWRLDYFYPPAINARLFSGFGAAGIQTLDSHEKYVLQSIGRIQSLSADELVRRHTIETQNIRDLFLFRASSTKLIVPIWFLAAIVSLVAIAPWLNRVTWLLTRRTLIIAATLIALVLGLAVWLANQ
jgi:hypothetical protein